MTPLSTVFLGIVTFIFAALMLYFKATSSNPSTRNRLGVIRESVKPYNIGVYGTELKEAELDKYSVRLGRFLQKYSFARNLKLLLVHANSSMNVGEAVVACVGCMVAAGSIVFYFTHAAMATAALSSIASATPYFWFRFQRNRRVEAFNTALPDAIDLMARALRAGHAMGSAIEMVSDQSPEPIGFEFFQVYQQQRLGLQFRDALLQMGGRVPSRDLQFLVTAILVQKETGGDLTEILDRASHVIRERVRIEGEVRTHTAQGRLTGWILGLLPIIMLGLINLLSPGYSTILFHDPTGQKMLYAGVILILIGGLIIRKIVDVQV